MTTCGCEKVDRIIDVDCEYADGKFKFRKLPSCLPELFTVRFKAPADFTEGDTIIVKEFEMPVTTPGMTTAPTGLFANGAIMHCDIDMDRKLAFIWQSAGQGGMLPNLSYSEQFAGFLDWDGDKVYVKTVDCGQAIYSDTFTVFPHGIPNIKKVVRNEPLLFHSNGGVITDNYYINSNDYFAAHGTPTAIGYRNKVAQNAHLLSTLYYTCTDR